MIQLFTQYTFALIFGAQPIAFPETNAKKFIAAQTINDHFRVVKPVSTVSPRYRPGQPAFEVPYALIPVGALTVKTIAKLSETQKLHLYAEVNGRRYLRFFIHPDSVGFYGPLIRKYGGIKGHYKAEATASVRVLLAKDPLRPELAPVLIKTSLAKEQFGLGRIISDWEVRRSVGISSLIAETPKEEWLKNGLSLIPEFAGAYVHQDEGIFFEIDQKQPAVFQHGVILRDTGFFAEFPGYETYPVFSLFARRGDSEPLIIEWWRKSGMSFEDFMEERFIQPLIESTMYLVFEQGIVPEMHGQNLSVAVDPKTKKAVHFYHQDLGSMKVSILLRWLRGRGMGELLSASPAYDFKFGRANEIVSDPFAWFYDYIFSNFRGSEHVLKTYMPTYSSRKMHDLMTKHIHARLDHYLPVSLKHVGKTDEFTGLLDRMNWFIRENAPTIPKEWISKVTAADQSEVDRQHGLGQYQDLPTTWANRAGLTRSQVVKSPYGMIAPKPGKSGYILVFPHTSKEQPSHYMRSILVDKIVASRPSVSDLRMKLLKDPTEEIAKVKNGSMKVIRYSQQGTEKFLLVGDHLPLAVFLKKPNSNLVKCEVIADISELPWGKQKELLRKASQFSSKGPHNIVENWPLAKDISLSVTADLGLQDLILAFPDQATPIRSAFYQVMTAANERERSVQLLSYLRKYAPKPLEQMDAYEFSDYLITMSRTILNGPGRKQRYLPSADQCSPLAVPET